MDTTSSTRPTEIVPDADSVGFPFDPRDPVFRANPYPTYDALRENTPVLATPIGLLVLSRHDDCVRLLHNPNDVHRSAQLSAVPGVSSKRSTPIRSRDGNRRSCSSIHRTTRACAGSFSTRSHPVACATSAPA